MEAISPFVLRALACDMEEMQSPQAWADRCRAAAAEIEKLRAERDALRESLRAAKDLYLHGRTTSAFIEICAALGEKE
jgi:hypothetical protein